MNNKTSSKGDQRDDITFSSVDVGLPSQSVTMSDTTDRKAFSKFLKNNRFQSKLVYVLTVSGIVFLAHATLSAPWFIPYIYASVTPFLLILRLFSYWQLKYQYFLLDFCYFANLYLYIFMWVFPDEEKLFIVGYAVATGPLLWSLLVFRNSLVFHSLDKITSMYIHTLPPLLVYVIRWYPDETSRLWHRKFTHTDTCFSVEWLIFIPFAFSFIHQVMYGIFVYGIMKPSSDYLHTFNHLVNSETSIAYRICNVFGPRFHHVVFGSVWLLITLVILTFNLAWYNYYAGNCAVMIFFFVIAVYNGATYYIDVFSNTNEKVKRKGNDKTCNCNEDDASKSTVYGMTVHFTPDSNGYVTKPM